MARKNFEHKLDKLKQEVLKMGSMVEEAIYNAISSLEKQDIKLAKKVIENDKRLNRYEIKIKRKSIRLIALQQPVAKDLRLIESISNISTDLERMGDLAYNIANITNEIGQQELIKPLVHIPQMSELVQKRVRNSLEAFIDSDIEQAKKIAKSDEKVDELNQEITEELIEVMTEKSKIIKQANRLMFVSRYLERIADHTTNICERIIYISSGERVSY